ncbi:MULTISPECIES: hypothetical protein [Ensifer]|jgi:hypothetical protein|uniref:hypothetical protein n=1 Tax=Ensifer TaxID=106591 RepID=UPI000DD55FD5|nr:MULTISPECIES: hypothetical protein [Ensifer]MBD9492757.1 hypothetical protein [Ensifer sp. ENS01]MBD9520137.1 hypothetical protein [Ensifer sp. ENS02]
MGITLLQVFQGILQQDGFVKNNGKIVRSHDGTDGRADAIERVKRAPWRPAAGNHLVTAGKGRRPPLITAAVSS